jgi:hypothetical protein
MTAQIQLPVSAVLPTVFDAVPVDPPFEGFNGEEPSEFTLHLLAMEFVRHAPVTAQKVALAGLRRMGGA